MTSTGIVKTAPWHELSDAFVIETAFTTVSVAVWPAVRSSVTPLWFARLTPVAASQAAPLSEVIVPLPETAVIRTGNGFGLVARSFRLPVAPG